MKYILSSILILYCIIIPVSAEYDDIPMEVSKDAVSILEPYSEMAKSRLDYFDKQFDKKKKDHKYYIVTRLYEGDIYEQVFVELTKKEKGYFSGTIVNEPMGRVKFTLNDSIRVYRDTVVDWLIIDEKGNEEGNLLGKSMDLLRTGFAAFFTKMKYNQGSYVSFEVVSVQNPQTKQEIIEIVPAEVLDKVAKHISKKYAKSEIKNKKDKFTYTFVYFPSWEIYQKNTE